jgi:hypothetical protein
MRYASARSQNAGVFSWDCPHFWLERDLSLSAGQIDQTCDPELGYALAWLRGEWRRKAGGGSHRKRGVELTSGWVERTISGARPVLTTPTEPLTP